MKKKRVIKHILACTLAFSLTASDIALVMAADMQPSEDIIVETETRTLLDEPGTSEETLETQETLEETLGTPVAQEDEPETPVTPEETPEETPGTSEETPVILTPSITQPAISVTPYSSYFIFQLNYTETDCDYSELTVKTSNTTVYQTNYYSSGSSIDSDYFNVSLTPGATYTFTLTPYVYDDNYDKVTGTARSVTWTAPTIPTVTGLAVKEMTSSGFLLTHNTTVPEGASIRYEYSTSSSFDPNAEETGSTSSDTLSYGSLIPGVTYYVRACISKYGMSGNYSSSVKVTAPVAEVTDITTEIANKSITLSLSTGSGAYTGFEISRKVGGKYQVLTTTASSIYKDTGLKKNTKYRYRVRAIYYNADTKKTVYGDYSYATVTTGAAALNLKANPTGKKTIKLTWAKIAGAAGYDVYRVAGTSWSSTYKSGEDYDFTRYELVKSLGKAKKAYTDKKLTAGEAYSYRVAAYKLVKGKKQYITQASASATTKFSFSTRVEIYKEAQNPKTGKVAIAWKQIPQAGGYLIEKYDETKGTWVQQAKLNKASKTTYTLPASPAGKTIEYRVRAFKSNKYSNPSYTVDVTGHIAVVTGVKAAATSDGIKVSWSPVSGASYYRVYRTTDPASWYNSDLKTYVYGNTYSVTPQVYVQADADSSYYYTLGTSSTKMRHDFDAESKLYYHYPNDDSYISGGIVGTSVVDYAYSSHYIDSTTKKDNVTSYGPKAGVTYYYYVVAYKVQSDTTASNYTTYTSVSSYGNSQAASAAYAGAAKVTKPTVKVKAAKKKTKLTIKKVTNATSYAIYRSTKKKSGYELVDITTKLKYTDSKLTSKKTYYYKVKAIGKSALGTDVISSFSKVNKAKVK